MPNILHILTDQQRADTIAALGNPVIQTPHLDRLCREGTVFNRAYTPAAECVPARACMITGLYADRTGCGSNADPMPGDEVPTLMSLLAQAGYRTHGVGKCHFTPDPWAMKGFQSRDTSEEIARTHSGDDFFEFVRQKGFGHVLEPHGIRGEMYYVPQPSQLPAELHHSHWVADRCIDFINRSKGSDQPWYLYAGFIQPHPPFAPPSPWHKLYRAPEMPLPYLPENAADVTCFINRFQNRYKYRDRGMDLNLVRCIRAFYFACISFIDHQLGRMLAALEAVGELDDTLVVYTSDHGELLGDFGCFGKRGFQDAAMRIPLILRHPGRMPSDQLCDSPASLVDLLPTFLSAAGVPVPDGMDGVDLLDLANGKTHRDAVYFHYAKREDAILGAVTDDWKYAWSAPDEKEFLFPVSEQPEIQNMASNLLTQDSLESIRSKVQTRAKVHPEACQSLDENGAWKRFGVKTMPENPDEGLLFQDPSYARVELPVPYRVVYPRENFLGI